MKSGNIYIPVLPDTPIERFKYIVNDTSAKLIITNKKYENNNKNTGIEIFYIEDFINKEYSDIIIDNPKYAYIIYTSGTSGNPKGIKFTHYNFTNGINSHLKNLILNITHL
jgi:non-ribosomal peptide synthetase component F